MWNDGFIDGHKRVAFACMDVFPGLNGARLEAEPDEVTAFIYRHLEAASSASRCPRNRCAVT